MEQRNLVMAIVLSLIILVTFQFLIVEPRQEQEQQAAQQQAERGQTLTPGTTPGARWSRCAR